MANARSVVWQDANGYTRVLLLRGSPPLSGVMNAAQVISNAAWLYYWDSAETTNVSPVPVAAPYLPGNFTAVFTFICADNTEAVVRVPAPAVAIFMADQRTVDQTNVDVVSLVTACIGTIASTTGSLATSLVSARLESASKG